MRVRKIISGALKQIGVLAAGETASAEVLEDSLDVFHRMLDEWETEDLLFFNREIITIPAGKDSVVIGSDISDNTANTNQLVIIKIYDSDKNVLDKASSLFEVRKDVEIGKPTKYIYFYTGGQLKIFFDKIPQRELYAEVAYLTNSISIRNENASYLKFDNKSVIVNKADGQGGYLYILKNGDMLYAYQFIDGTSLITNVLKYSNGSWKQVLHDSIDKGSVNVVFITYNPGDTWVHLSIVTTSYYYIFHSEDLGDTWVWDGSYDFPYTPIAGGGITKSDGSVCAALIYLDSGVLKLDCNALSAHYTLFTPTGTISGAWIFNIDDNNLNKVGMLYVEDGVIKFSYTDDYTVGGGWKTPTTIESSEADYLVGRKVGDYLYWAYNNSSGIYLRVGNLAQMDFLKETLSIDKAGVKGLDVKENMIYLNILDIDDNWNLYQYDLMNKENMFISYPENITSIYDLDADSDIEIPPGWYSALVNNLALELAPLFGINISRELYMRARESKLKIKKTRGRELPLMRIDL